MTRNEVIQFRVSAEEKKAIAARARAQGLRMSDYLRSAALADWFPRELTDEERDALTKLPPGAAAERKKGKPESHANSGEAEASLQALITQLKGQGMTTPVARREAKKRLGL